MKEYDALTIKEIKKLAQMCPLAKELHFQHLIPIAVKKVTLSTGGGSEAVSLTGVLTTDVVQVSLMKDDTGTSITTLVASVTANGTITITRTDDGSSNDDAIALVTVYRLPV